MEDLSWKFWSPNDGAYSERSSSTYHAELRDETFIAHALVSTYIHDDGAKGKWHVCLRCAGSYTYIDPTAVTKAREINGWKHVISFSDFDEAMRYAETVVRLEQGAGA